MIDGFMQVFCLNGWKYICDLRKDENILVYDFEKKIHRFAKVLEIEKKETNKKFQSDCFVLGEDAEVAVITKGKKNKGEKIEFKRVSELTKEDKLPTDAVNCYATMEHLTSSKQKCYIYAVKFAGNENEAIIVKLYGKIPIFVR